MTQTPETPRTPDAKWSIVEARRHFAELIDSSAQQPQPIYKRGRLVAAVVDAETYTAFDRWQRERKSLGDVFRELRQIEAEEEYRWAMAERRDRLNPFVGMLDDPPA
jgi:prevent-host-death family protein